MSDILKTEEFDAIIPYIIAWKLIEDDMIYDSDYLPLFIRPRKIEITIELPYNLVLDKEKLDQYFDYYDTQIADRPRSHLDFTSGQKRTFTGVVKSLVLAEYIISNFTNS